MVTLVGNAATAVEHRQTTAGVTVARFRLAATSRRWDRAQERWTDGGTSFYTVRSWRALADNVAASVAVGEPLVVQGRLRLREGEQSPERGGQRWFSAEVDAVAIGHDLARGTAAFRRAARPARTEADHGPSPSPHPSPPSRQGGPEQQETGEGMLPADRTPPSAVGSQTTGEAPPAGAPPTPAEVPTQARVRPPAETAAQAGLRTPAKRSAGAKRTATAAISPPAEPLDAAIPPTSRATHSPRKAAVS
ncbi:single-stranded DNA-binding protein [Streptomyces sp. NPDC054786]